MTKTKAPSVPFIKLLLAVMLMIVGMESAKGQRIYANAQSNSGSGSNTLIIVGTTLATWTVTDPTNSIGPNLGTNYTNLNTDVIISGGVSAWQELKFTGTIIPAGTTTYVKVGGLSGNLLGLLGGAEVVTTVYSDATASSDGNLIPNNKVNIEVLTMSDNSTYLAVNCTSPYNAIRIANVPPLLISKSDIKIYHAFFEAPLTNCSSAFLTTTKIEGLVSLLASVDSPNNAIDGNMNTASVFNSGVGIGATLHQKVYYSSLSNIGDVATVTISLPPALLAAGVLSTFKITPYKGNIALPDISYTGLLLGTDLLTLLNTGNKVTISFLPTDQFDRIDISMGSVLSVGNNLNVFEIQRTPPKPTFTGITPPTIKSITICPETSTTLSATTTTGNELVWYNSLSSTTALAKNPDGTFTTPLLSISTNYYVAARRIGCSAESERVPINVIVNNIDGKTIGNNQVICSGTKPVAFNSIPATGSGTITYQWQSSFNLLNSFQDIVGATLETYTEPSNLTQTKYYRRIATSTLNGKSCSANSNTTTVTVTPLPSATILGSATVCQNTTNSTITFTGSGGTAPYIFTYKINNGQPIETPPSTGNSTLINISTNIPNTYTYDLIGVKDSSSSACYTTITGQSAILKIIQAPSTLHVNITKNN